MLFDKDVARTSGALDRTAVRSTATARPLLNHAPAATNAVEITAIALMEIVAKQNADVRTGELDLAISAKNVTKYFTLLIGQ